MAKLNVLQNGYGLAMRRDGPREAMPKDSVWGLIDYLPEILDAKLRKRGGYAHVSQDINAVQGSASYLEAGIVADYTAGQSILAFDEDGRVYEIESDAATENIGAALRTRNPIFYNDLVIVPDLTAGAGPKKITRAGGVHTVANLGGSPPSAQYGLVYKDVIWLGNTTANPRRTFFSVAGNAESYDTTNKYMDISYPISGYAALANAVLIFSNQRTTRVRGSIPPPDTDFVVDDPVFNVGCTDNRSIAYWRDKVIFANAGGIYITDGTEPSDLTKISGMKSWWRDVTEGRAGFATGTKYSPSTFTIAGGVFDDFYVFALMNGTTLVDAGMIELNRFAWTRLRNFDATFFFPRLFPQELFFTRRGAARVADFSGIFAPSSTNKNDADGDAVLPEIEYPYWEGEPGIKTLHLVVVGYDVRDAASDNPDLQLSYIDSPEETSYTTLTPNLDETLGYTRASVAVNAAVPGFALKITQTAASADTRLYAVEAEIGPRERSRG